jgi:hypothetical protein
LPVTGNAEGEICAVTAMQPDLRSGAYIHHDEIRRVSAMETIWPFPHDVHAKPPSYLFPNRHQFAMVTHYYSYY